MTEDEARAYVASLDVPRETLDRLDEFVGLLKAENLTQNLIAASTVEAIWSRHIADSAQLVPLGSSVAGRWIDLGSGPGFPGLIVAALATRSVTLVEERARRASFLHAAAAMLNITDFVDVCQTRAERLPALPAAVISARAFAPLTRLFATASHLATSQTLWLLPKGRSAPRELEEARRTWQGDIRLVQSVTDPEAAIVVATGIRPR